MCFFRKLKDKDIKEALSTLAENADQTKYMRQASTELLFDLAFSYAAVKTKNNIAAKAEIERRKEIRSRKNYCTALATLVVSIIAIIASFSPHFHLSKQSYICSGKDSDKSIVLIENGIINKTCTYGGIASNENPTSKGNCGNQLAEFIKNGLDCKKTDLDLESE